MTEDGIISQAKLFPHKSFAEDFSLVLYTDFLCRRHIDERERLHFYLGDDVPRRIRDDPSLGETLSLIHWFLEQDKINGNDFTFLMSAFDEIQCFDAVNLLKGSLSFVFKPTLIVFYHNLECVRLNQVGGSNQSIGSLPLILAPTTNQVLQYGAEEEDHRNRVLKHRICRCISIFHHCLESYLVFVHQENLCYGNNDQIHSNDVNINQMPTTTNDYQR